MTIKQRNSASNLLQECHTDIFYRVTKHQNISNDILMPGITEVKVNYVWKDNEIIQLGGLTF